MCGDQPNRLVAQECTHDAGMAQAVHCHFIGIEADGGDNLGDFTMILLAGIIAPRATVFMQQ